MNNRIFATVLCLGFAGFAAVSEAQANPWNKRTILTVHESI
jgi:hypothetical protein